MYEAALLKTMTFVAIGDVRFMWPKIWRNVSRNCSSFVATLRMSFSDALPISRKFFVFTWTQSSLALAGMHEKIKIAMANATRLNLREVFIFCGVYNYVGGSPC